MLSAGVASPQFAVTHTYLYCTSAFLGDLFTLQTRPIHTTKETYSQTKETNPHTKETNSHKHTPNCIAHLFGIHHTAANAQNIHSVNSTLYHNHYDALHEHCYVLHTNLVMFYIQ